MTENQLTYGNKAKNLEFVARNTDIEIPYFKQIYLQDYYVRQFLKLFPKVVSRQSLILIDFQYVGLICIVFPMIFDFQ